MEQSRQYAITAFDARTRTELPDVTMTGAKSLSYDYAAVRMFVGSTEAGLIACAPTDEDITDSMDALISDLMAQLATRYGANS